eukprot:scaffold82680_cov19-Tisochrysis_lutea.AAC.1
MLEGYKEDSVPSDSDFGKLEGITRAWHLKPKEKGLRCLWQCGAFKCRMPCAKCCLEMITQQNHNRKGPV